MNKENLSQYISERIRILRENAGISVNALANKSGISQSYVRDIELGNKDNISVEKLNDICRVLDISLKEFFDDTVSYKPLDPLTLKITKLTKEQKDSLLAFLNTIKN